MFCRCRFVAPVVLVCLALLLTAGCSGPENQVVEQPEMSEAEQAEAAAAYEESMSSDG